MCGRLRVAVSVRLQNTPMCYHEGEGIPKRMPKGRPGHPRCIMRTELPMHQKRNDGEMEVGRDPGELAKLRNYFSAWLAMTVYRCDSGLSNTKVHGKGLLRMW